MEDFTNRHEKKIKCFRNHMNKFRHTFTAYAGNDIKYEWIRSAKDHYAKMLPPTDEIVGLYDTSSFGKGKCGYLFTDDVMYWKRSSSVGMVRMEDIEKVTYYDESKKDTDRGLIFYLKDGSNIYWKGFWHIKFTPFIEFLNEYIKI